MKMILLGLARDAGHGAIESAVGGPTKGTKILSLASKSSPRQSVRGTLFLPHYL